MVRFATVAALLGACSFRTNPATGDAKHVDSVPVDLPVDVMLDSPPPVQCTSASATCLDTNTLETCTGPSATPVVTTCSWGCITAGTDHCGTLTPSGGAVTPSDLMSGGGNLGDVTLGTTVVDTEIGTIVGVTSGYTFTTRNNVGVFRFHSLTISGQITFTGKHAAAFVALGTITVGSTIDARGPCALSRQTAGPGGSDGGNNDTDASGNGGGAGGTGKNDGGGGGGYGGNGGQGGNGAGGTGGPAFGDAQISQLVGGGGGGGGHNPGHTGGGGGGALQLVSNTSIVINSGGINAGGCGGTSTAGDGNGGGGGGGAGGAILLEGPTVRVSGNLAVNGGAGGGNNTDGGDGSLDATAATNADGGGAAGAAGTTAGTGGATGGGGGGGVGRIRINTRSGQATITGTLSPTLGTTTTQGTATVN